MVTPPNLDSQSAVPLYRQLHSHFERLIQSGQLARGERLPATRELAGMLGLNRTTVSAAYELLESEGLIAGHVGRGSFVIGGPAPATGGISWESLLDRFVGPEAAPLSLPGKNGISFAASRPSEQLFPLDALRASCEEVMAQPDFASILQLGASSGYEPLRRYLLERARSQDLARPGDDLIVTSGCQQALDLIARVLLGPRDKVLLEDPVYPGLKNLFAVHGAELLGVPVTAEGIDVEQLERILAGERPRLLVATSNFQNPTGATLPLAARQALLRAARRSGVVVVENDLYGELRYRGDPLPGLKQLDESGDVVLLRSFSKITFPGLRVGWVIAPKPLVACLAQAKQLSDLHTDQFSQAVLLRFAESGRLEEHRQRMLHNGSERLAAVLAACERYLPPEARFTRPQGGMNLWVRLPEPLDAGELLARALREQVAYLPGRYFAVSRPEPGSLRLSFAGLTPEEIRRGLSILGGIFGEELERVRANRAVEPAPALV
ncbi:MAG TPA: PLP-dependent aminotransferase family protein [Bryobacteraceae bacterium]|nr:PLP-dependent aminotransferase family protein [Bryobacteraceae bacterium]